MKLISHSIAATIILALLVTTVEYIFLEEISDVISFTAVYLGYFIPLSIAYMLLYKYKGKPEYSSSVVLYQIGISFLLSAIITLPVAGIRIVLDTNAGYFNSYIDMFATGIIIVFIYFHFFPDINSEENK